MLSKEEQLQYNRHLIFSEIGEEGQLLLKKAKVLVIGAGGLSCPVLSYLTAAGVGHIGIIDPDRVDQSNLQRQILYGHKDIGQFKATAAKNKLEDLNPLITIEAITEAFVKENALALADRFDLIVDGSDNFQTRYLVNDASALTNTPLVFASIFKFEGQISVFNYKEGPSYRCLYPSPPAADEVPNCSAIGVLGILPGIIGSLQANEALKLVLGKEGVLSGKLLNYNALNNQQYMLNIEKTEQATISSLMDNYEAFCGIKTDTTDISPEEFKIRSKEFDLLDVRTIDERARQHLGGTHIPLHALEAKKQFLPKGNQVLVYCQSGVRSKKAIEILEQIAPEKTYYQLKGGIAALS